MIIIKVFTAFGRFWSEHLCQNHNFQTSIDVINISLPFGRGPDQHKVCWCFDDQCNSLPFGKGPHQYLFMVWPKSWLSNSKKSIEDQRNYLPFGKGLHQQKVPTIIWAKDNLCSFDIVSLATTIFSSFPTVFSSWSLTHDHIQNHNRHKYRENKLHLMFLWHFLFLSFSFV